MSSVPRLGLILSVFLLLIVSSTFVPQSLHAQSLDVEPLRQANQLYENGQFNEAANRYQQLADQGVVDGILFYNLGNAYMKQGDVGRAILNYERAVRLLPRDDDVQVNLALARSEAVDQYEGDGESLLNQIVMLGRTWLTRDEMALLALGLWMLLALIWVIYRRLPDSAARQASIYGLIVFGVATLVVGLFLGSILYTENTRPQAIVVTPEVDVLSGPGDQYITEFVLHSGAKVTLLEDRGGWVRLSLPGEQLQGWVEGIHVEMVSLN